MLVAAHPIVLVERLQVERPRVAAKGFLALDVVERFEVRHHQFAQRPVDRLAEAQPGEVGLRDRAPASVLPEQRDEVAIVVLRVHLQDQRRISQPPKRRRSEQRAVEAVRLAVLQDPPRAAIEIVRAVGQIGEERLDPGRAVQARQRAEFAPVEESLESEDAVSWLSPRLRIPGLRVAHDQEEQYRHEREEHSRIRAQERRAGEPHSGEEQVRVYQRARPARARRARRTSASVANARRKLLGSA